MKNIGKTVGKIVAVGGLIGGLSATYIYLLALGTNHLFTNREFISNYEHSITRPDGAFGRTTYSLNKDGSERVYKSSLWSGSQSMIDGEPYGEPDGLVDRLYIEESGVTKELLRSEDYERYNEEFEKADKILAETRERFREDFK